MTKSKREDHQKRDYYIIGIDGGGTRTRGVLEKNGETIATAYAGTTRVGAVGVGESTERLLNVIKDLCEKAAIDSLDLDAVVIGLAGVWLEEEKKRSLHLMKTLARVEGLILNDLMITSDAELAIHGAFGGKPGIVLIVGTGSIAIAKSGNKLYRAGGWGIELDDEGSGAWIGREGITAILRALDGRGAKTILAEKLAEMLPSIDLNQPRTIVKAYADRNFEYQLLTPLVMQAAVEGDKVALDIIKRASSHIMELLEAVGKHFKTQKVDVALFGGVIENKTLLKDILEDAIKKSKKYKLCKPKGTAIDGAMDIAKRMIKDSD